MSSILELYVFGKITQNRKMFLETNLKIYNSMIYQRSVEMMELLRSQFFKIFLKLKQSSLI